MIYQDASTSLAGVIGEIDGCLIWYHIIQLLPRFHLIHSFQHTQHYPHRQKWLAPKDYSFRRNLYLREDESISVNPIRVFWVICHNLVEKNVSNWGHSPTGCIS
jgi:hypothetical protein